MNRSWIQNAALSLLAVFAVGCAEKLTFERYQTIHTGQEKDLVRQTLGDPFADTGTQYVYTDNDRGINAFIYFDDNGRVAGKEWHDTQKGVHDGKDPRVNKPGDKTETRVRKME